MCDKTHGIIIYWSHMLIDSIDAYRSQRKIHPPSAQNMTSGVQKQVHEEICPKQPVNTKEKIKV